MGREGNDNHIFATVNNRQVEHQSVVVDSLDMLNHVKVEILFDYGAIESFILACALEKCVLEIYEHDGFKQVYVD